jgi:hypothetical protein
LAVRLQLKLGAVTEQDRLPDSPDTIVVVEPSVGSVGRTKGNLYLLVTAKLSSAKAREATRMVADTIRNEYYYDESAGIRQCLTKVLGVANKRLAHQRDKLGLGHQSDGAGPIGVAVAVVRGRELYVATVGPAEAYLIRQARLSTLPDPNGERGMPSEGLEPEVWRGELNVGDSLCLVSRNVVGRIGTDTLKDALVTLHPQSAIEHIHAQFRAADGKGSDGAFAFEAAEVGATFKQRALVPVRPAEPLAGAPDKSPIPLADGVTAGAAAVTATAGKAKATAGSSAGHVVGWVQDMLPKRKSASGKVTTASSRAETQRRAAVALLAFIGIAGALVLSVYAFGSQKAPPGAIESLNAAEVAFTEASKAVEGVSGPGIDLIANDPDRAMELLTLAYAKLDEAEEKGYPKSQVAELRATVMDGLDRLYGVVPVAHEPLFTFPADTPVELAGLVRGSDGAPYVLDTANKTVWRIDLAKGTAAPILKSGDRAPGGRVADPAFITTGGPDVLVLDAKNQLWRWRPANTKGKGTLVKVDVVDSASWGNDIKAIDTFVANFDAAFYKLYIADPSEQNIMVLSPANDGSGYPVRPTGRLPTNRPIDGITDLLLDGDIYVAEDGKVARVIPANSWSPDKPRDTQLRPESDFTLLASPDKPGNESSRRAGLIYAYDRINARLVAFDKASGDYVAQFRLAGADPAWTDLRGMVVMPGADAEAPALMWWIDRSGVNTTTLVEADAPAPTASPSASPTAEPTATPKPTRKPKPTPRP